LQYLYKINLNNAITLEFELLYKIIIKRIENNIIIQEININNNSIAQQVANINISNLINIISKEQKLVKKIIISKIVFSLLILLATTINNLKTNKTLYILTRVFEELKIHNVQDIIKSEVY